MIRLPHRTPVLLLGSAALLAMLAGCTTAQTARLGDEGTQATIEGSVANVDTSPWAYDGNAVVTVSTTDRDSVSVHLPARWNLCKAPAPEGLQRLKPGDRVQATGTVDASGALVVCERAEHQLRRMP